MTYYDLSSTGNKMKRKEVIIERKTKIYDINLFFMGSASIALMFSFFYVNLSFFAGCAFTIACIIFSLMVVYPEEGIKTQKATLVEK